MTNNNTQITEPLSAQESVPQLDEQTLEKITGSGPFRKLVSSVKGCFGCGAPKWVEGAAVTGKEYTGTVKHVLGVRGTEAQAIEAANRLSNAGVCQHYVRTGAQKGCYNIVTRA